MDKIKGFLKTENNQNFHKIINLFYEEKLSKEELEKLCIETKNYYYKGFFFSLMERTLEAIYYFKIYFSYNINFLDEQLLSYLKIITETGALYNLDSKLVEKLNKMKEINMLRASLMIALVEKNISYLEATLNNILNKKFTLTTLDIYLINDALFILEIKGEVFYDSFLNHPNFKEEFLLKYSYEILKDFYLKKILTIMNTRS